MKTKAYTPTEEIKAMILLMVLTLAFLVSKAQTTVPVQPNGATCKTDSSLLFANDSSAASVNGELVASLKDMMNSGAYWSDSGEDDLQNRHLNQMLSDWMKNGLYWEENQPPKIEFDYTIAENEMNNN